MLFVMIATMFSVLTFAPITSEKKVIDLRPLDKDLDGKNGSPSQYHGSRARYGNNYTEIFENWDNLDKSKTTASVQTMKERVYLWGTSPIIPPLYENSVNMNTHSHGGGFSPKHNEYWYPQWAGSTIYRYDINRNYIGSFNSGTGEIMQLWGDMDGTYYTANWNRDRVYKWGDMNNNQIWSTHLGSSWYVGGVCCDENYVYAMKYYDTRVYVMRKDNGQRLTNLEFNVGGTCYLYGGLAVANGYLYIGGYNRNYRQVGIYNLKDRSFVGTFQVACNIYNMAFDGEYYCPSQNSNTVHRYKISDGNAYLGEDVEAPTNITHAQSKIVHRSTHTIGAARMRWYELTPPGTDIIYNLTVDGRHWVTMENNTNHVFEHQGSPMRWNITLKTDDKDISPYLDKMVIDYDYVKPPENNLPRSDLWLGTSRPKITWNFTDPDRFDHQSDYLLEIYRDTVMENMVYNSTWVNTTEEEHQMGQDLDDGYYYWRVRTKDAFHAASNWSVLKSFKIDITKPVGNITIEENVTSVNSQLVYISIEAFDNASKVKDMQLINDQGIAQQWEPFKTEKRIALSPTDGLKTVGVRFRDRAGIVSDVYNDSIYLDYRGPGDINITSPTHPDQLIYYNSTAPVFIWEPPYEITGIKGYSYLIDEAPTTEPNKDPEEDLSGTVNETMPGEFTGFTDGVWFFHIATIDVYDQWSNTSHYQFNIDSTDPMSILSHPTSSDWFKSEDVECYIIFEDKAGYGLDLDTIEYSYMRNNDTVFSSWSSSEIEVEVLKNGIQNNPVQVKASATLRFQEGEDNIIRWRIRDLAGNGPIIGEECRVKVDLTPPSFSDQFPLADAYSNEESVDCGITVTDLGSGVDGGSLQYAVSYIGKEEGQLENWTSLGYGGVKEQMEISINIDFKPGRNNYIRWRARDSVRNAHSVSDPIPVWVNSAPIPNIHSPLIVEVDQEFTLDSIGSVDNEDDELSFFWQIKNSTTKRIIHEASGSIDRLSLSLIGDYFVYLYVNDGHGFNESSRIQISVVLEKDDINNRDDDDIETAVEENGVSAFLKEKWWILVVMLGIFMIFMILVMFIVNNKRQKAEEEERRKKKQKPASQDLYKGGRYSSPTSDYFAPQSYSMYGSQQDPYEGSQYGGSYQGGQMDHSSSGEAANPKFLGVDPEISPQPLASADSFSLGGGHINQDVKALPPPPSSDSSNSPPPPPGPPGSEPTYTLPTFNTDEGKQNLNLVALPPAPPDN